MNKIQFNYKIEAAAFDKMGNVTISLSFEGNFILVFVTLGLCLLSYPKHTVLHQKGGQLPTGC